MDAGLIFDVTNEMPLSEYIVGSSGHLVSEEDATPPEPTSIVKASDGISSVPVPATWLAGSRNATRSVVMQDTTEWPLWKGAYVVPRMLAEPEWDSARDLSVLTTAARSGLNQGPMAGKEMLVGLSPDRRYWSLTNGSSSNWAETTLNIVGANFNQDAASSTLTRDGTTNVTVSTNPSTKLTVTLIYYCEMIPPADDVTLLSMAKPAAIYDPHVLEVYSATRASMPVATPVKNNAIGGWLLLIASLVGSALRATSAVARAYQARQARQQSSLALRK